MRTLKAQGRCLAWDDGTPFFYLGDTAWELFHRLNREEMDHYFAERARQGFTAVQAVALAEFEGVTVPNAPCRCTLQTACPTRRTRTWTRAIPTGTTWTTRWRLRRSGGSSS